MNTFQEKIPELIRIMKTHDLIGMLAESDIEWTQEHIDFAIKETDCAPFSIADVAYRRALLADEYVQDARNSINYLGKELSHVERERRLSFYDANIAPNVKSLNRYKECIRLQFDGLVFYTDPCC